MKKYVIISVVIIVFYSLWLAGVPYAADLIKPYAINIIEKQFGYNITEKNLHIKTSVLPYIYLNADSFIIKNPVKTPIINITYPKLKISLFPLLAGKIHIKSADIETCKADIYLDEKILKDKKSVQYLKNIVLNANSLRLGNYMFKFAQIQNADGYNVSGQNLYFSNNKKVKNLKCSTLISANGHKSVINADIYLPKTAGKNIPHTNLSIKDLNISPVFKYFNKYLPDEITSMQGIINVQISNGNFNTTLKNVKIIYKDEYKSIIFPETLTYNGLFNITEKDLDISSSKLRADSIDIQSNIKIKNYMSQKPNIEINTTLNNIKTGTVIKMLPAINSPDINLDKLKKYPLLANTNGYLHITGHLPEPDITGNILINNGYLIQPIPNDKIKATIKLTFKDKAVHYDVLTGAGGEEQVTVIGNTKLYGDKYSKMEIKSTQNVKLSTAQFVVEPLHKILYFDIGPVPIMKLDGYGNINIRAEGNRKNPHVWGKMNFRNSCASFTDIKGLVFKNLDGVIEFNNQKVAFKLTKGFLDGNPVNLSGECDLFGNLKVNIDTKNLSLSRGLMTIKSSPMLKELETLIPPVDKLSGTTDLNLIITGTIPDINNIEFNKNLFARGSLKLNNVTCGIKDITISNINGNIKFDGTNVSLDTKSQINDSVIMLSGDIKNNIANIRTSSQSLNLKDILGNSVFKGLTDDNYISFNGAYNGKTDNINFDKITLNANIIKANPEAPVSLSSGNITVKNGTCTINNIRGSVTKNPFVTNAKITHLGKKNQNINAEIKLDNANLSAINLIREFYLIPEETKELLRKLDFKSGKTDINLKIVNNKPYTNISLNNVETVYLPLSLPVKIINGRVELKNNRVLLNKINSLADDMPIFIDGSVNNIYKKPYLDTYLNSVPKQSFIDKYINKNIMYPLKIKGDIIYSAKIRGNTDLYNISANAKIGEKANIYYLGATIGDGENETIIDFDGDISKNNSVKINDFSYNKSVLSQNNRSNIINFLKIKGSINLINNTPYFNNLVIKTENPTDARIFNVIFKKPNIKQGLFTSNLKLNGNLYNLKILGDFHIFDINVPLLQTIVKDISLNFHPDIIKISSKGEIFSNEINLDAEADNRLKPPFRIRNGLIHFKKLDINAAIADLKQFEINKPKQEGAQGKQQLDLGALIIEKLDLTADDILIKGISAKNLKTIISLTDKMNFSLNNYSADIANGELSGDFSYNFLTNRASVIVNAEDIDANNLSDMLFDLPNQMYGSLTGTTTLTCNGSSHQACMSTLSGNGTFNVSDGRMPKLGSLEYLLKAGNLIKGGLTDLSINSIIDIITPLKTGEFSDISGSIKISGGIAEDIKISTKGENLNLYMKGNYNLVTSNAQMYVFGLLSKKIKTPLGAVGNMSLNTLFNLIPGVKLEENSPFIGDINKIPGIELSKNDYRKFIAEIRGDITGEGYVKSFRWVD